MTATEWVVLDTRALRRKFGEDSEYQTLHKTVARIRRDIANLQEVVEKRGPRVSIDELRSNAASSKALAQDLTRAANQLTTRIDELLALCQVCWVRPRSRNRIWQGETLQVCRACLLANDGT